MKNKGISSFADVNSKLVDLWRFCKDNYKDDSTRKFTAHVKAFLRYCIRKGYYTSAEYDRLDFPKLNTKARDTIIADHDWELIQQETAKDKEFYLYLKVLWNTGLRPSEAFQLVRSKINFNTGEVFVYQNKTKTTKSVFLPKSLLDELFQFNNLELIFSPDSKDKEFFSHKFAKLKKRLNLNPQYNLYAFRHTFATNLLNHNGDLHLVNKLLGHADVSITAKHYINRSSKDLRDKLTDFLDK
ncbi:MAG: tyrosine-type recombinase/integrase [Brevinema sp.]